MRNAKYLYIKHRKRSIGKKCLRCRKRNATITAVRLLYAKYMNVWYCEVCWDESVMPE